MYSTAKGAADGLDGGDSEMLREDAYRGREERKWQWPAWRWQMRTAPGPNSQRSVCAWLDCAWWRL